MALQTYYPEMSQARPEAKIDARMCYGSDHWMLKTHLELKGRGVKFLGKIEAGRVCGPRAAELVGMNEYKVTQAAFERICELHQVATECLL